MKHNCVHQEIEAEQTCRFRSVVVNGGTRTLAIHNIHEVPSNPEWNRTVGEIEIDGKIFEVVGKNSLMFYRGGEIEPSSDWSEATKEPDARAEYSDALRKLKWD